MGRIARSERSGYQILAQFAKAWRKPAIRDLGRGCTERLAEGQSEVTVMAVPEADCQLGQVQAAIRDPLQGGSQADLIEVLMDGNSSLPPENMT